MKKPVLVLGGGIAGIQASLDLAEMGVPVFLVERAPSIGGRMAQLDKTFPTNDCSACILAPKVTACYNHPLVKTYMLSELTELKGEAPNLTAVIKKKARFIDEENCRGCNACIAKCPITRKSEFDMGVGSRRAVYKPYAQAVPNKVVIEKKGSSPCKHSCPANIDIHGCVALAAEGRYAEALEVIRRTTPFAGVLGRICPHPCEDGCSRRLVDAPVAIAAIERYAADHGDEQAKPKKAKKIEKKSQRVAVVGAGPAGLSCAYRLALEGYPVTVFEADTRAGGTFRSGLAKAGLAAEALDKEIKLIEDLGVEIIFNASEDDKKLKEQGYKAVFVATGAADEHIQTNTMMQTIRPGVFAGGEAATGPSSVIEAIADGNRAAKAIRNYMEGTSLPLEPPMLPETPVEEIDFTCASPDARAAANAETGLTEEEARREAGRCIDCSICCECGLCEKACGFDAIRHGQRDETIELPVSAVIIASGYDPACDIPDGFGYGRYKDVVTSLEYERILSASGPYEGHVKRPSDGREPEKIAFIQCASSRDEQCDRGYCSAVCCMYAVKEAIITREHLHGIKNIDIFYMDMRAYGKDFDRYVDSAKDKYRIGFIRSRISDIARDEQTGRLLISYCDEKGDATTAEYDMVVLSVGMSPDSRMRPVFEKAGVKTERHGFIWVDETDAPKTSLGAVLACGAVAGPKDIPETVVEASAAASEAAKAAGKSEAESDYGDVFKVAAEPLLKDVSKQPARIGVFVCHCGQNIAGYLDVKEVARYAKTLPGVAYATDMLYACSVDSQKTIADRVQKSGLTRVVIASCSPRTHEPLFREAVAQAGINPYLLTMANIRDQCSWVHMEDWAGATEKAKDLVRMAVGRSVPARQLYGGSVNVIKSVLVIGGGVAGMTAALEIAGMGYQAYLAEKTGELGGNARKLDSAFSGRPVQSSVERMIARVENNDLIEVYLNAEIKNVSGSLGIYKTVLESDGKEMPVEHGAVIIATGAGERLPAEYLYGNDRRVITQMELEEALKQDRQDVKDAKNIYMIQCVGSRDAERPYCSRVCCSQAIRNALEMKRKNPDANVTVLYRDIRSYGLNEQYYRKARQAGVQFVRYDPEAPPEVSPKDGKLSIRFIEPLLDARISSDADLVVLASAIVPDIVSNRKIAQLYKVPMNQDGFFLEAHAKLRPVDFATDGVYLCGLAHAPKTMKESIVQGKAAAARAATVISKDALKTEGAIAEVDTLQCTGCGDCEKVCAFKAITMEKVAKRGEMVTQAKVNPVLCKGCGTCSAACRCGAIGLNGFSDRQVLGEIEYLLKY
jgi:heterodisulfide reductase subunit A-like polyferredoxin